MTSSKNKIPNVSGQFYPDNPAELSNLIDSYLKEAKSTTHRSLQAIIAPHAGYSFSGPVAGSAYKQLEKMKERVKSVVVMSPSHFEAFSGIATLSIDSFTTPLGEIPVHQKKVQKLLQLPQVVENHRPFDNEHALEVHLPFLQKTLFQFKLVPLIVGQCSPREVAEVINEVKDQETFLVVSSDLSHYHNYTTARTLDNATSKTLEEKHYQELRHEDACGYYPLCGLLKWAGEHEYNVETIDLRSSGDTAGDKDRVVGYGAYVIY